MFMFDDRCPCQPGHCHAERGSRAARKNARPDAADAVRWTGVEAVRLLRRGGQRLVDVPQDVVDVLEADRDPNHVLRHAGRLLLRLV